jgi:GNAT superfamily N-acetyltransferase
MTGETASKSQLLQSYETESVPLTPSHRDGLHGLSVSVCWPHRPEDLSILMEQGRGFVALDEIDRMVGSAMYFPMGDDFAMIGMVMTAPRLQALGAGRWLMNKVEEACAGRDLRLNSTRAARRLYHALDYRVLGDVNQQQGYVRAVYAPDMPAGGQVRALRPGDWPQIVALDAEAFGIPRDAILAAVGADCYGSVYEEAGEVTGFALCRAFGRGQVIGPIVAGSDRVAMVLCMPHLERCRGTFLRVDTASHNTEFSAFLGAAGLGIYDTVTTMAKGTDRSGTGATRTFGLIGQGLG